MCYKDFSLIFVHYVNNQNNVKESGLILHSGNAEFGRVSALSAASKCGRIRWLRLLLFLPIMSVCRKHIYVYNRFDDFVNQAVFFVDTATPYQSVATFKLFWFAGSCAWMFV